MAWGKNNKYIGCIIKIIIIMTNLGIIKINLNENIYHNNL